MAVAGAHLMTVNLSLVDASEREEAIESADTALSDAVSAFHEIMKVAQVGSKAARKSEADQLREAIAKQNARIAELEASLPKGKVNKIRSRTPGA
jgi:hypothetical protein